LYLLQLQRKIVSILDDCAFGKILKKQIKRLEIINEDRAREVGSLVEYTERVYVPLLNLFENIEYLNVIGHSRGYVQFSLHHLPSNSFSCSNLTYLCIKVLDFVDCLCILDGRFNQLKTFIVVVSLMQIDSTTRYKAVCVYILFITIL